MDREQGTKPDFHKSMGGEKAREIYEALLKHMKEKYRAERIKDVSAHSGRAGTVVRYGGAADAADRFATPSARSTGSLRGHDANSTM